MKRSSSEGFTRSAAMSDDEPLVNPSIDLTDEIRELRQRQKEFNATNEHDTYLIVVFSTSADRQEFLEQVNMREEHTVIDLALIHISEPTRQAEISFAVFCLKK